MPGVRVDRGLRLLWPFCTTTSGVGAPPPFLSLLRLLHNQLVATDNRAIHDGVTGSWTMVEWVGDAGHRIDRRPPTAPAAQQLSAAAFPLARPVVVALF